MKIIDIIIIITIILIVIFIIYLYNMNKKSTIQYKLKNLKKSENIENTENTKSEKETYEEVQKLIIDVIHTEFNYNYKLDNEEETLLYPNYKKIADRIIKRALKYYDIYEIKELVSLNGHDFIAGLPNIDTQFDKKVNGLQIASIKYLLNKFPNIEPHVIIKYIKNHEKIFPIVEATYKDNKLYFNKEQMNILNNFK